MRSLRTNHFWFHRVAALIFCTGIFLHGVGLVEGREYLIHHIYTPAMDAVFALPMAFAALGHWMYRKVVSLPNRARKVAYYFSAVYLTISVPLHIRTVLVSDTSFVTLFPWWYSYLIIPVQALMAYFSWTTRFVDQDIMTS